MKRSEIGKATRLLKANIDEEKMWGEAEVVLRKLKERLDRGESIPFSKHGVSIELPHQGNDPKTKSLENELELFHRQISGCLKCPLGKTRTKFVFGVGNPHAALMFVGEGPGFDEDHKGEPFVGRAGQMLTKIIEAMGMRREDVYIGNLVKCHPMIDPKNPEKHGNDRPPSTEEIACCLPYLENQISIIKPKFICTLGTWASRTLMNTEIGISKLRGNFTEYKGIPLLPTYHPAALLRNPALKKDVWHDMKKLLAAMKEKSQ